MTSTSRFARTFTDVPRIPTLDLDECIGQRTGTFRFDLVNAVTGYRRVVTPIRERTPTLTHDTTRTIKRTLSNVWFGVEDSASINVISDRLEVFMLIAEQEFPLGKYVFNVDLNSESTAGDQKTGSFYDLGFIVDQPLLKSYPLPGVFNDPPPVINVINNILADIPVTYTLESSPYVTGGSWRIGTPGGYALEQLAVDGDYLSPWFDNTGVMRFIRSFDAAAVVPTFDYDTGAKVLRDGVVRTSDLITAANRFVVISNGAPDMTAPITATYNVPASAPHSAANRGFVVPEIIDRQAVDAPQAAAMAQNIGQRQTVFERLELYTAPDPRHDSYDVFRWKGENWLEIAWSMPLAEGSEMRHVARKVYPT